MLDGETRSSALAERDRGGDDEILVGLSRADGRAIFDMLFRHIDSTPRLHCRVEWRPNTSTFWDDRCTQHHAVWDDRPHTRRGERVPVLDDRAPAA